jgi:hypothetical protein
MGTEVENIKKAVQQSTQGLITSLQENANLKSRLPQAAFKDYISNQADTYKLITKWAQSKLKLDETMKGKQAPAIGFDPQEVNPQQVAQGTNTGRGSGSALGVLQGLVENFGGGKTGGPQGASTQPASEAAQGASPTSGRNVSFEQGTGHRLVSKTERVPVRGISGAVDTISTIFNITRPVTKTIRETDEEFLKNTQPQVDQVAETIRKFGFNSREVQDLNLEMAKQHGPARQLSIFSRARAKVESEVRSMKDFKARQEFLAGLREKTKTGSSASDQINQFRLDMIRQLESGKGLTPDQQRASDFLSKTSPLNIMFRDALGGGFTDPTVSAPTLGVPSQDTINKIEKESGLSGRDLAIKLQQMGYDLFGKE